MRLTHGLHRARSLYARKESTVYGARRRTWGETVDRIARFAAALRALGAKKGDIIAINALNSDYYLEAYFAVAWAGCVAAPSNTRWSPGELKAALEESTPAAVLADRHFFDAIRATGLIGDDRIILLDDEGAAPGAAQTIESVIAASAPMEDDSGGDDDLAALFYTGGTTGSPKGVMLTHKSLMASFFSTCAMAPYPNEAIYLHSAPMFHLADAANVYGLTFLGGKHVIVSAFDPVSFVEIVERENVESVLLVPTMIGLVVQHMEKVGKTLPRVRHLIYGASPISEPVLKAAMACMPNARIVQAYGQTELSPVATVLTDEDHKKGGALLRSAGRAAPLVELAIWNEEGEPQPVGAVGEIVVRGDMMMQGYWKKPAETAKAIQRGWVRTGDAGYLNEDGYLFLVDRVKDMIISGGENVYSAEVEKVVALFPAVLECVVIGVPDEKWGERVHAVIRLREGMTATAEELDAFCRDNIAHYKRPRSYTFREEPFPLSAAGKILKVELRKPYWSDTARAIA